MKKTYFAPTAESIKLRNALMMDAASVRINASADDAVGFNDILSKDDSKGDGFWE